jgi:hypothetical protein
LGSKSYFKLADEFLVKKNINVESAAWARLKRKD